MGRRSRNRSLIGLEIEPGAVSAARVAVNGTVAVEHAASVALEPHVVRDGEVADPEALAEAIRRLWAQNKGLGKQVRVGVANARIVVRTMDLPPIEDDKELAAAVRFQAQDELPMPLDSAVLDFQPVGTIETPDGPRRRVVVVAARRDMVERVLAATRAAGLRPEGIDLSAFAMIRALRRDADAAVYLSVGGLTNLAVADERACLFTRVTGGGLESMAATLAERSAMPLDDAHDWLRRVGLEAPVELIDGDPDTLTTARGVLVDGVHQLSGEVRSSLDFHHAQPAGGAVVQRVVLTGPAAAIPGFAEALSSEVGLPVETRVVGESRPGVLDGLHPGRVSVAAGLALEEVPA